MTKRLPYLPQIAYLSAETKWLLPLMLWRTSAGFPSPAEYEIESRIDLNRELILHPNATYLARNRGDSMINVGIFPNSLLIIDRELEAKNGDVVVARIENEFCVKRLSLVNGKIFLLAENELYAPIEIKTDDFEICARVTYAITKQ